MIRPAQPRDLDRLCAMAQRFSEGSGLPLTFDPIRSREVIWDLIHSNAIVLVCEYDGILTGFVYGYLERDFSEEPCASISKFFLDKEFRGLGDSLDLMEAFEQEAKTRGAKMIFSASHTGVLFGRLLKRCGFSVTGQALVKEI